MSMPTVCAIMLTRDRPEMAARAVRCFERQTYPNKRLLIWDTGELYSDLDTTGDGVFDGDGEIVHIPAPYRDPLLTIGALRNEAIGFWNQYPILCHWDDDDMSHPRRIEEQVALLMASPGVECVGYNEMLFWRDDVMEFDRRFGDDGFGKVTETQDAIEIETGALIKAPGEAWLYHNVDPRYCTGTSMCYLRRAWERRPFPDMPKNPQSTGEDVAWQREVKRVAVNSLHDEPRMIATIHGSNSQDYSSLSPANWQRAPEFDERVRQIVEQS